MKRILNVLVVLVLAVCGSAFGATPIVWVVPSTLSRIGPTDAAGSGTTATLHSGKAEYVAFQVAVHAPTGGLTNLNFSVSNLTGPGGAVLASTNLIRYRESYITVPEHSATSGETSGLPYTSNNGVANVPLTANTFADGLIPFIDPATGSAPTTGSGVTQIAVPVPSTSAGNNVIFWVDTYVPSGTPAGQYTGTYTVTSSQGNVTGNIQLTVWDFTLPLKPSLKSLFNGGGGGQWPTGLEAELLRNKLMPDLQSLTNEGTDISQYGLNSYDMGYYENTSYGSCTGSALMPAPPTIAKLQAAVNAQQTSYPGPYLVDYTGDPESSCTNTAYYNSVIAFGKVLHKATVTGQHGVDNMVSQQPVTALFNDGLGTGRSAVDVWAVLPMNYDLAQTVSTSGMDNVTYAQQKGDKIWSYNDTVQDAYSPKWELDFLPINYRMQAGFLGQSLGIKGMNYWAAANWDPLTGANAWTSPSSLSFDTSGYYFPSEGILVYPGAQAGLQGVAPSMRLKYLRDGVQDYEYIQLLKNCGQTPLPSAIDSLSSSGTESPNWHDWTTSYQTLESARITLGNQIATYCGSTAPTVTSISIAPTSTSLTTGATQAFSATAHYSDGSTKSVSDLASWASSNAAAATISTSGEATGVATGSTNMTAALGSITSNTAAVTVSTGAPLTVSITAPANNATVSGTITLKATASGGVGGVAGVQFVIDLGYSDQQNAGSQVTGSSPYSTTFNTGSLSPAWYNISAVATDTQSNTATSTIEVQVTR